MLQDQFNMDKSKLNWGLMSGIYPAVLPVRKYDPAGLGGSPETRLTLGSSPETRLTLGDSLETRPSLGNLLVTRRVGQTIDKTQRPRRRLVGRPAYYVLVGRLKRKGVRNIFLTRKQDPELYPACIRK